jgi:transposase InsO family protein
VASGRDHPDPRRLQRRFGAPRVHAELTLGRGIRSGQNAVAMLMRRAGLRVLPGVRRPRSRHQTPSVGDLVERSFARTEPNRLWVTDITEPPTREGKVYCCVVLDVFSRLVVGWSIDAAPSATLVTSALVMAIDARRPDPGALIHSDHGSQFTSWASTRRALASRLVASMGSIGDCYDNAAVESFWARMQVELLDRRRWKTRVLEPRRCAPGLPARTWLRGFVPSSGSSRWPTRRSQSSSSRWEVYMLLAGLAIETLAKARIVSRSFLANRGPRERPRVTRSAPLARACRNHSE